MKFKLIFKKGFVPLRLVSTIGIAFLSSCSSSTSGSAENPGSTQESALSYCSEPRSTIRDGDPRVPYQQLAEKYPRPTPLYRSVSRSTFTLNGVPMHRITFEINPIQVTPPGDEVFYAYQSRKSAILVIPQTGYKTNSLLIMLSASTGNGVGDPAAETWNDRPDKVRTKEQVPSWFHGTHESNSSDTSFDRTYANIATDLKVPVLFYDPVPANIQMQSAIRDAIRANQQKYTPEDICDDHLCDGRPQGGFSNLLQEDGEINQCLNNLATTNIDNALIHFPGSYYAIAIDRAIDAAQEVLNSFSSEFQLNDVIVFGGSKRGIAARTALAVLDRIRGGYSGHSNAGNFDAMLKARASVWPTTYENFSGDVIENVYNDSQGQLNQLKDAPLWIKYYDPIQWKPEVLQRNQKRLFVQAGTRDTYFNTGAELYYTSALPTNTQYLYDINYPHGSGTVDQAVSLRNFVKQIINSSPPTTIQATLDFRAQKVIAKISNFIPTEVELWCSYDVGTDPVISLRSILQTDANGQPLLDQNGYPLCLPLDGSEGWHTKAPDMRYSEMRKVTMTSTATGVYQANVPPAANSLYETYKFCVVRAFNGSDGPVVTSRTLMNEGLCRTSLLPSVNSQN